MKLIKPKKLNKGDKVAIVSLSSGILGEPSVSHQLKLGIKRLNELGLKPVFMPNALKGLDYIKNNPQARANDLKEAFIDSSIKGIICAIGGDDTYRTIPYLMSDLEFREIVLKNPKIFIGFSDSTNNHLMLNSLGLVTYYGLNFLSDICELQEEMIEYTKNSYLNFFENPDEYEIKSSNTWYSNRTSYDEKQLNTNLISHKELKNHEFLFGKDKVNGLLWGGCLESIYDIYSSNRYSDQRAIYEKYELIPNKDFFKDKILFLETSEEKIIPSKFLEVFELLENEGILENIKALLVAKPDDEVYYNEYKEVLKEISKKFNLPIVYNLNFGHALPRAMIPYGLNCEIDFNKKTIKVTESLFE